MNLVRTPLESRWLLSAASLLVPPDMRAGWRREWDGELWWWISTLPNSAHTLPERLSLAAHCAGAMSDALCLRLEYDDLRQRWRTLAGAPSACMGACLLLLALIGFFSGGFSNTRRVVRASLSPSGSRVAFLSQVSPFLGRRTGVPPRKVSYWAGHSSSLQGAAVYVWYRSLAGRDRTHLAEVPAARVGPSFFSLLDTKPKLGRLFHDGDDDTCASCAVVAFDFWKRHLGADPAIAGKTIVVDGRPYRVLGVLPEDFWFPDQRAAVWSIFEKGMWRGFPLGVTGAICRLTADARPANVERQLRTLARQMIPRESGTMVTVTPLDEVARLPLASIGPLFLGLLLLSSLAALAGWWTHGGVKAGAFVLLKALLCLALIFLVAMESEIANGPGAAYWILVAGLLAVRWAWTDQRKRCPRCLCRLASPVRIGEGSRTLLEPGGVETACPQGHGTLFTPEGESPENRWYPLDALVGVGGRL